MPIYEFRCQSCGKRVSWFRHSFSEAESQKPSCASCGSQELVRLLSRVAVLRSEDARLDAWADPALMGDLDENDPRSMGRWMRRMSQEAGEDLGDEFEEVTDRLESGQNPEEVEESMPDLGANDLSDITP